MNQWIKGYGRRYDSSTPLPGDSFFHYKQLMGVFFAKQQAKGRSPKQLIRFWKDLSIRQIHQRSRSNERREVLIQRHTRQNFFRKGRVEAVHSLSLSLRRKVSEPSTSTSSLIYKRVSEKCVLLCKRYIRRMFDIPMDVGLCWYPVWTSVASTFQIEPLRALFFSLFFPGFLFHIIIEQRSSTRASVSDQTLGDCLSP